jgi:hypothetical protein
MEQKMPGSPVQSDPTVNRTRSGRVSKPPERYEPIEQVEDDYGPEDYDSDDSDGSEDIETDSDEYDEDDDDEIDENGDLKDFIVPDKSESDEEDNGPPPPPVKKTPVRRPRA